MRNLIFASAFFVFVIGYSQEEAFKNSQDSLKAIGYPNGQLFDLFPNEGGNFTFIHEGKMGLANIMFEKAEVLIPPTYDLIFNERFAIKNGTIYYLRRLRQDNWNEYVTSKELQARKSLRLDYDLAGVVTYTVDGKYYEIVYNEEDDTMRLKLENEIRIHPEFSYELEKIDQQLYRIFKHDREEIEMYDDDGNIIESAYDGDNVAGIFNLKSMKWEVPPVVTNVRKADNGYFIEKFIKTEGYTDIYNYGYFKDSAVWFNHSDSMTKILYPRLLPKDAEPFMMIDDFTMLYKKNGKMGLFHMDLDKLKAKTVFPPKYEYLTYSSEIDVLFYLEKGILKGKPINLHDQIGNGGISEKHLRNIKSFEVYADYRDYAYEVEGISILINDKLFEWDDEKNDLLESKKMMINKSDWVPKFELYRYKNDKIINSINNQNKYFQFDEYGEEMYDYDGNPVYNIVGNRFGIIYDLKKKSIEQRRSRIAPILNGLYIEEDEKNGSNIQTKKHFQVNKTRIFGDKIWEENGLIFQRLSDKTSIWNKELKCIVPPEKYNSSVDIKDGILFAKGQEIINEWGDYEYDENGEPLLSPELLLDFNGDSISTGLDNWELLNDQIMIAQDSNNKFILFDLKYKKKVAGPFDIRNFELPKLKGNKRWIQEKGKISLYQVGRKFTKISKESYTKVEREFIDDMPYFMVNKDGLYGYYDPYGKQILQTKYQKIEDHIEYSEPPSLKDASLILKQNGKFGLYNIHYGKIILNCIYDSIYIASDVINVKNENGWGIIDYQYIRDHGKIEWQIQPKYQFSLRWNKNQKYIDFGVEQSVGRMTEKEKVLIQPKYSGFESLYELSDPKQEFIKTDLTTDNKVQYGIYLQGEKELLPCEYDYIGLPESTNHPIAFIGKKVNGKMQYGIYNLEQQKVLSDCKYKYLEKAGNHFLFLAGDHNGYYILDSLGNKVPNFNFKSIKGKAKDVFDAYYMEHQYYLVKGDNGMGLFNSEDISQSIPMEYDSIQYYDFPLLSVWKNGLTGLFNVREKELVIPVEFNSIQSLNQITIVERNGVFEFRNNKDSVIIENVTDFEDYDDYLKVIKEGSIEIYKQEYPTYTFLQKLEVQELQRHFECYQIKKNGKYGLLDENYKVMVEPKYDLVHKYSDELIIVGNKNPWAKLDHSLTVGILNYDGKEVLPMEYKYENNGSAFYFLKDGKKYLFTDDMKLEEVVEE